MTADRLFLEYSVRKLTQSAGRVDECLARLTEEQIWARGSANENAIGNLAIHLCGNVSQWILGGVAGQESHRDRDSEFAATSGPGVRDKLRAAVERALPAIAEANDLTRIIQVQNYELTVLEAIYHVVEHFGGHAGQIIFATKMLTGDDLGFYRHLKYASHRETTP